MCSLEGKYKCEGLTLKRDKWFTIDLSVEV